MSVDGWFVASLDMVVLAEKGGMIQRAKSVVVVRASGFAEAFEKACNLGLLNEESYINSAGERIRWAFERVATVDALPEVFSDGMEIYFELGEELNDLGVPFDVEFSPRSVPPGQSGVSPGNTLGLRE